jgi:hypothetical protein
MKLSPTLALSLFTTAALVAVAWGYQKAQVAGLQKQVDALRQACVTKEVYAVDMKWIDAITEQYYQEIKKK